MTTRIFLTTDLHLGHEAFTKDGIRPQGFSEKIITNLNRILNPSDVLICLGDVCFGDEVLWHMRLSIITCKKWLIRGNHDKKSLTWYLEHCWDMVCDSFSLEVFGKKILFSHVPLKDNGVYDLNIHGHFHSFSMEKVKEVEPELFAIMNPKHRLVSLEALHYEPIKLQRFLEINS